MTIPSKYTNHYMPVKYFLASYRALSDGRSGIRHLEEQVDRSATLLTEWRVNWIGSCTLLRTAIDLFRVDAKSCLSQRLREEIAIEWKLISERKADHQIFWEFLRRERDNIIHDYNWRAYEAWMKPDGTFGATSLSLLSLGEDQARRVILMKSGHFKGRNSLELLNESADWVETRIFGAIRRAGYNPEEERGLFHFQPKPTLADSILRNEIPTLISSAIAD